MRRELYVGTSLLPIKDNIPVPVTYSVTEINDISKRKAAGSKTIVIPASKEANKLFGHYYEISADGTFNPNLKTDAIYLIDGLPQIAGNLQLLKVTMYNDDPVEYECAIYGPLIDLVSIWGELRARDLDWSDLTHDTLDAAQQSVTWGAPVGEGYIYPLIDYGGTSSDPTVTTPVFSVYDLAPGVYLREYFLRMFQYAGFQWDSAFFDSELFKRIFIPSNINIQNRPVKIITLGGIIGLTNAGSTIDTFLFRWVIDGGTRIINVNSAVNVHPGATVAHTLNDVKVFLQPGHTAQLQIEGANGVFSHVTILNNSYIDGIYNDEIGDFKAINTVGGTLSPSGFLAVPFDSTASPGFDPQSTYNTSTYIHTGPAAAGINQFIPDDLLLRDLFQSIVTRFNLYILPDRNKPKLLHIEPHPDFYSSEEPLNWTDKVANEKEKSVTPLPELNAKRYIFTDTDDTDFFNKDYLQSWNQTYGREVVNVSNDFIRDERKYTTIFAPTPMVGYPSRHDGVFPTITKETPHGLTANSFGGKIRLLYYGGLKTITGGWRHSPTVGFGVTYPQYPYCGHLDDPYNPTFDLNFGAALQVYYGSSSTIGLNYTNANCYNSYWKQFIEEITDKDSKMVELWMKIDPTDIYDLDFRRLIFIMPDLYKLHEIIDYDPSGNELTKVRLLKTKLSIPFTPTIVGTRSNGITVGDIFTGELRIDTADDSPTELLFKGGRIAVPLDTMMSVNAHIAVKQQDSNLSAQFLRQFVIVNHGGTPTIEGVVNTLGTDSGSLGGVSVSITADDGIKIEGTGLPGTNLRWSAILQAVSIKYSIDEGIDSMIMEDSFEIL